MRVAINPEIAFESAKIHDTKRMHLADSAQKDRIKSINVDAGSMDMHLVFEFGAPLRQSSIKLSLPVLASVGRLARV
jgi:hypothetical protein